MRIPEISRDLEGRVEPKVIYHMQRMQEEIITLAQQIEESSKILVMLVQTLENVQKVNLQLADRWEQRLGRESTSDMVQSVLPEPEEN